mmetsp:Transcript_33508/g.104395  ORF Transcript_33508/g.104395 Transcript_33508/m.104395 type:complete len:289 (-) Transcript_33508:2026-2892(-)
MRWRSRLGEKTVQEQLRRRGRRERWSADRACLPKALPGWASASCSWSAARVRSASKRTVDRRPLRMAWSNAFACVATASLATASSGDCRRKTCCCRPPWPPRPALGVHAAGACPGQPSAAAGAVGPHAAAAAAATVGAPSSRTPPPAPAAPAAAAEAVMQSTSSGRTPSSSTSWPPASSVCCCFMPGTNTRSSEIAASARFAWPAENTDPARRSPARGGRSQVRQSRTPHMCRTAVSWRSSAGASRASCCNATPGPAAALKAGAKPLRGESTGELSAAFDVPNGATSR